VARAASRGSTRAVRTGRRVRAGSAPLWVAVLSGHVLHEKVSRAVWGSVVPGFAGVAVLMGADLDVGRARLRPHR
jgi:hypothetical protein